jgi:TP901 family phage tail tape measure protein
VRLIPSIVETSFVLLDKASPTVLRLRSELRELQVQADATGVSIDRIGGVPVAKKMEKHAAAAGMVSDAHAGVAADAAAAAGATKSASVEFEKAAVTQEKAAGRISRAWDSAAKSASNAAAVHRKSASSTSKSWAGAGSSMVKMGKLVTAATAGIGIAAVDLGMKWQASTRLLQTQAGASTKSVKELQDGMLKMAGAVAQTPQDMSEGMYHVVSSLDKVLPATHKTAIELGVLHDAAKLADVGQSNLKDTAYVLSSTMQTLGQKGLKGASADMRQLNAIVGDGDMNMQDLMGAMSTGFLSSAKTFGISLHSAGAALAFMTDRNVPAQQAATRLRMTFSLLGAPTKAAAKDLHAIGFSTDEVKTRTTAMNQALLDAGVSQTQISADLRKPDGLFVALSDLKQHMIDNGVSAQTQAAVISRAFGGGRSGGTVMALYNGVDNLQKNYQHQTKIASQFDSDWVKTQHNLSFQLNQAKDAVLALGTKLGMFLIPWVERGMTAIKKSAQWFEKHTLAAEALAGVIGGVLVASVVALGVHVAKSLGGATKDFLSFGKAVATAPFRLSKWADTKLGGGGGGAPVTAAEKAASGLPRLVGWDGQTSMVGSKAAPLAVLVVDPSGSPMGSPAGKAATAEEAAAAEERTAGGVVLPAGVKGAAPAVEKVAASAAPVAEELAGGTLAAGGLKGLLAGAGSKLGSAGSLVAGLGGKLLGGVGIAGMGLLGAQLATPLLAHVIGGKAAGTVGGIAKGAAIGAGVGSIVPGVGTGIGAGIGAGVVGIKDLAHSLFGGGPSPDDALRNIAGQMQQAVKAGDVMKLRGLAVEAQNLGQKLKKIPWANEGKEAKKFGQLSSEAFKLVGNTAYRSMLHQAVPYLKTMAKQAGKSLGDIQSYAELEAQQLPITLGKGTQAARDAVALNFATAAQDIAKSMASGVISTGKGLQAIQDMLTKALASLGVKTSASVISARGLAGTTSVVQELASGQINQQQANAAVGQHAYLGTHAQGGRLPGPARGDHIPVMSRGGQVLGIADGGELIVNRHTERRVDGFLSAFGTRLSREVGNETRPHSTAYATGGRVQNTKGSLVTASDFNDPVTASGRSHIPGFAELSNPPGSLNFSALGHLPMGTNISVTYPPWTGKTITIPKIDVGAGGSAIPPATVRGVDLTLEAAAELPGFPGLANVSINIGGLGSGAGGGMGAIVPTLKAPHVGGAGVMQQVGQGVVNKVTAAANTYLQAHAPAGGMAGGGISMLKGGRYVAPPTGVPKAVDVATQFANAVSSHNYPYLWGGGHNPSFSPPYDCSGAVSADLHAAGLISSPETSAGFASYGDPGPGRYITLYVNPGTHVFESINGRFFGTSTAFNPGGGANWMPQMPEQMPVLRHPPGLEKGGRVNWTGVPDRLQKDWERRHALNPYAELPGMSLGGRMAAWAGWHARGTDVTVRRPTLFGAGENGTERITVTPSQPAQSPSTGGGLNIRIGSIKLNGLAGRLDERRFAKLWGQHMEAFVELVEREIEEGAELPERQLIA